LGRLSKKRRLQLFLGRLTSSELPKSIKLTEIYDNMSDLWERSIAKLNSGIVTGREEKIIKDDSSLKALHAWFKQSAEKQKKPEKGGNRVIVHWKEAPSLDASRIEAINYLAVIEKDGNGKYRAYCPALKGVSVNANSFEVVKAELQNELERYLNDLVERGETVPVQQACIAMMSARGFPK